MIAKGFKRLTYPFSSTPLPILNNHALSHYLLFPLLSPHYSSSKSLLTSHLTNYLSSLNTSLGKSTFSLFSQQVQPTYKMIREDIVKIDEGVEEYEEAIHWPFRRQGKQVRPIIIAMLSALLQPQMREEQSDKILRWGSLIQLLHIASLVHDDVIDRSPLRRGLQTVHSRFSPSIAIFLGNYIVAKGTSHIKTFNDNRLFQIYSHIMQDLANGELVQANRYQKGIIDNKIKNYLWKTYLKTGALISHGLKGVPVILGIESEEMWKDCFKIGEHFGIAFQLVDDVLDFVGDEERMGKEVMSDLRDRNITLPILLEILINEKSKLRELVEKKREVGKEEAERVKGEIVKENYIELVMRLAGMHVEEGLKIVSRLGGGKNREIEEAWKYLGYLILSRDK